MSIPEISCDLMFFPSGVQVFALCYPEKTSLYVIVNIIESYSLKTIYRLIEILKLAIIEYPNIYYRADLVSTF